MGESISLLLMALLSLQSGPTDADDKARAAQRASTPCAVVAPAPQRVHTDKACIKQVSERPRVVRTAKPRVPHAGKEMPTLSASAQ